MARRKRGPFKGMKRGLFSNIFGRWGSQPASTGYFKTLTAYSPVFTTRDGGLYEMELTRSAIHASATHASKLKPEVSGSARTDLARRLQVRPNPWQNTSQFLYRTMTIVEAQTTCFLIPVIELTSTGAEIVTGAYPIVPSRVEVVEVGGEPWLRFHFRSGEIGAMEMRRVGILTKFQFGDDFFGAGNGALSPTLDVMDLQRQAMESAIKSSAAIRFIGRLAGTLRPEDVVKERERFAKDNLSADNETGMMLVDGKYADVKQVTSSPYVIDAEQMKMIQTNVFNYFGVNEAVLQNSYDEEGWNAFYEGKIEQFALQLSLALTIMFFSDRELAHGNEITFSSNRLQYASNTTKLQVVKELSDRGLMSNYQACDIFSLPRPKDASGEDMPERWIIRGEYIDVANLDTHTVGEARSYLQPNAAPAADEQE